VTLFCFLKMHFRGRPHKSLLYWIEEHRLYRKMDGICLAGKAWGRGGLRPWLLI